MEALKEYLIIAMSASIMVGLAESLVKEGTKPFVRFISGLFIIILLAFPVLDALTGFTSDLCDTLNAESQQENTEYDISKGIVQSFGKVLEESVKDHVCNITGFDGAYVLVFSETDSSDIGNIKITKITVKLYLKADADMIRRSVENKYGAYTEVYIID